MLPLDKDVWNGTLRRLPKKELLYLITIFPLVELHEAKLDTFRLEQGL